MKSKKIIFISNKAPHYRIPFFNKLSEKVKDFHMVFTHEPEKVKGLLAKHKILKGFGKGRLKINLRLRKEIEGANLVVFLPTDFSHLADNLVLYRTCRKKRIPYIIWSERWDYKRMPIRDRLSNKVYLNVIKGASKVIVPGKKSYDYQLNQGIYRSKLVVAPNASEIIYDKKTTNELAKIIKDRHDLKGKRVVLYIGRLIGRKGLGYLIEGFSKIGDKSSVLMIVGGGDFYKLGEKSIEGKLKRKVKEKGLKNVIFTGEVSHEETAAYYSLADVFVYPSITENISEPWGLALNEAMQFGLPLVSTDAVGAAYDLIEDGQNGFVVPEKNSRELRIAIEKVLKDPKVKNKMGKRSLEMFKKKYNYDQMVEGFLKVLEI
jgi:glycosyltransferase involved in cell wall biosynthesis